MNGFSFFLFRCFGFSVLLSFFRAKQAFSLSSNREKNFPAERPFPWPHSLSFDPPCSKLHVKWKNLSQSKEKSSTRP
jgi:hypothetical protein